MIEDLAALTALLLAWRAARDLTDGVEPDPQQPSTVPVPAPRLAAERSRRVWAELERQFADRGAEFSPESLRRQIPALAGEGELLEPPIDPSWVAFELGPLDGWERGLTRALLPRSLDTATIGEPEIRATREQRLFLRHFLFGRWLPDPLARARAAEIRQLERLSPARLSSALQRLGQRVMPLISSRTSSARSEADERAELRRWVSRQIESTSEGGEPLPDLYQNLGVAALSLLLAHEPPNVAVRLGLRLARPYGLRLQELSEGAQRRADEVPRTVRERIAQLLGGTIEQGDEG